jgi:N-acetylneuraminate 9-O-acetyltransferase
MTGFGNFSFFYIKGDYGSVRVLQMLWRLNFLVLFLCLTQGTTYILYYICLLHTYYFMLVYVTMRVFKNVNHSKFGIRIKLMVVAVIIYVVWDLKTPFFWLFHRPFLGEKPMLGATAGSMWEWYFRSSLDHWSTFMGMTFALNFPIVSLFFRKLEAEPLWKHVLAKALTGIAFAAATVWWVVVPFRHGKFDYNQTNAYFAWIPLYSYIYFRNLTPWLRNHTLDLLHQIGKTTLETYLMQHHIWLTSDAKSLLTLIPGWPMMNFLLVSIIYVVLSRRLYQLTLFLRGMVLPDHRNTCIRNLLVMGAVIAAYLLLAVILKLVGALNLTSVLLVSASSGLVLYRYVVSTTWSAHHASTADSALSASVSSPAAASVKSHLSPLVGAAAVLAIGVFWHHAARSGASKIVPLPSHCQAFVQGGAWVAVDACNEGNRGEAYRDHGVAAFGTCAPADRTLVWGWKSAPSNTLCRFAQRDATSLLKRLNHRRITFLGDSTLRHLFHASRRMVGDSGAGAYNTTIEKWSNFPTTTYKGLGVDFFWAPFTDLLITSIQKIKAASKDSRPDLVVLGGGAWDRLHRYNNESEQLNLKEEVRKLASELKDLRSQNVPIVWVTPTTINRWALMTEAKQIHINEENIASIRTLYRSEGVHDSVSFVIDGPAFTKDRVSESYDGVHYPLSVYNAGAQILANSLDWLLVGDPRTDPFTAPQPGKMAHPMLGLYVLAIAAVVIFFFDGMLGLSYFAGLVVPSVQPVRLYEEAFTALHAKLGLPSISPSSIHSVSSVRSRDDDNLENGKPRQHTNKERNRNYKSKDSERGDDSSHADDDDNELNSLLRQVSEGDETMIRTV